MAWVSSQNEKLATLDKCVFEDKHTFDTLSDMPVCFPSKQSKHVIGATSTYLSCGTIGLIAPCFLNNSPPLVAVLRLPAPSR